MVRIFVGVTHKPWFDLLAGLVPDEVNFWQPSGSGEFRALKPGDLFLFKLKAPWNAVAGGGVFEHASLAPLSLAWEAFGTKNGNPDLASMRRTIAQLRRVAALGERDDPVNWLPRPDPALLLASRALVAYACKLLSQHGDGEGLLDR